MNTHDRINQYALKLARLNTTIEALFDRKMEKLQAGRYEEVAQIEDEIRKLLAEISVYAGTLAALIIEDRGLDEVR